MFRRLRREELVAAVAAPILVGAAVFALMRRDADATGRPSSPTVKLDDPMPVDENLRSGKLANGLRYFILPNSSPDSRAELRLALNAGAVLEGDDQRGLAHAVEHMVFRGTKHYPRNAVDNYLQSIGMRAGSDINAWTTQDETVYRFTVPTDRAGVLDTALSILADMAHEATFDETEARQEAGVVMSEWRSRSDAAQRLSNERSDLLYGGSPYAKHPVIGDTAVLRKFDVGAMRRFYTDWYRPDLMAVVVVGDFEAAPVELLIRKHFRGLAMPPTPRTRPTITVESHPATRAAILSDPEATASWLTVWQMRKPAPWRTLRDYRASLVDELWQGLLSDRLSDAIEFPGSPVMTTTVDTRSLVRSLDLDVLGVRAMEHQELPALDILSRELARLGKFPVADDELKRRTSQMLRHRRNAEEWADRSANLADGLVDQFLTGNALVTRSSAFELTRDLLPTISAADLRARAGSVSIDSGGVLFLTEPTRSRSAHTTETLVARARLASEHAAPPVIDSSTNLPLIGIAPTPGRISSERVVSDAKVFDWTLENGMRVILKPTRFNYDQIEFRMTGPGGASLATDAEFASAYMADNVIDATGVGELNGRLLARRLESTSLDFSPSVRDDAIEMSGDLAPRDLELLFQLFYLHFTAPRPDTVAFRRYHEQAVSFARGRVADPDAIFSDSVSAVTQQRHPRSLRNDARFADAVDLRKAIDFWKARTANASGFTLVVTGDFTLDRIRPLVAKYLASLPGGHPEQPRDVGVRFPRGVTVRRFMAGVGPKARTEIVLSGPYTNTNDASDKLNMVVDLAEFALGRRLRERLGGTYDVSAQAHISRVPPARYQLTFDFEAAPEAIDSLSAAAIDELERLHRTGPTDEEADKIRAARVRDLDGKIERNTYWAGELSWHASMGWPLGTIVQHQPDAKLLSKETLRAACEAYLSTAERVQVTMYPRVSP